MCKHAHHLRLPPNRLLRQSTVPLMAHTIQLEEPSRMFCNSVTFFPALRNSIVFMSLLESVNISDRKYDCDG